ncbi:MAG TPA: hypothetical protein VHE13_15800 [Opitutus sp.]|nr:hypothetical protein [Opitutus sp.]
MVVNAKSNPDRRHDHSGMNGRLLAVASLATLFAVTLAPVQAARLAAPRVKSMNFFAPEELELGATAIAVSDRSEPLLAQFAAPRHPPTLAAAEVSPMRGPIATSLDATITASAIQAWTFDGRERAAERLAERLDATRRALDALASQRAVLRNDDAREAFNSALRAAEEAEQQLRRSLQATRDASEREWTLARSAVTADFTLYAEAVAKVEMAMAVGSAEDSGKKLG